MSEFHVVEIEMDDVDCLLQALKEMKYNPKVHQDAVNLYGYQGDKRKQKAHVVIPRSQVGSASNDVGFEKVDGKYIMHLSAYDKGVFKLNKLKQLYAKNKVFKFVKKNAGRYSLGKTQTKEDGSIKIKLKLFR
jgi:hypothetical protein